MLTRRKDVHHPGPVGICRRLVLGHEGLELAHALGVGNVSQPDPGTEGVDLLLEGKNLLLDAYLEILELLHLVGGKAQLILILEGQLDVLTQARSHTVDPKSSASKAPLGPCLASQTAEGQGQENHHRALRDRHDLAFDWDVRSPSTPTPPRSPRPHNHVKGTRPGAKGEYHVC